MRHLVGSVVNVHTVTATSTARYCPARRGLWLATIVRRSRRPDRRGRDDRPVPGNCPTAPSTGKGGMRERGLNGGGNARALVAPPSWPATRNRAAWRRTERQSRPFRSRPRHRDREAGAGVNDTGRNRAQTPPRSREPLATRTPTTPGPADPSPALLRRPRRPTGCSRRRRPTGPSPTTTPGCTPRGGHGIGSDARRRQYDVQAIAHGVKDARRCDWDRRQRGFILDRRHRTRRPSTMSVLSHPTGTIASRNGARSCGTAPLRQQHPSPCPCTSTSHRCVVTNRRLRPNHHEQRHGG